MKKSRKIYLHPEVNEGKLGTVRALANIYRSYLQECIDFLLEKHRCQGSRSEMFEGFFPPNALLTIHLRRGVWNQATAMVRGWVKAKYTQRVKKKINKELMAKTISPEMVFGLRTIGKCGIDRPWKHVTQETIDLYWTWLLDESIVGKRPTAPTRITILLNGDSALFQQSDKALTQFWLRLSVLKKGQRVPLPLASNPFVSSPSEVVKDFYLCEDKQGRLYINPCEKKEYPEPIAPKGASRVGVDVGLNVMASVWDGRNGRMYGRDVKPLFRKKYDAVKALRANRQRQGFLENSPRLNHLEASLTEMVRNFVGRYSTQIVKDYPGAVFVVEDLDLSGTKGQKRFAYRALHAALARKAPCLAVNPAYTSQQCNKCGYVNRKNRRSEVFACRACGWQGHADLNAGANLLGRSEDKEIGLDTAPKSVKPILIQRYNENRVPSKRPKGRRQMTRNALASPSGGCTLESLQEDPRLTTEGIAEPAGTAQPQNCQSFQPESNR